MEGQPQETVGMIKGIIGIQLKDAVGQINIIVAMALLNALPLTYNLIINKLKTLKLRQG